MKWLGSCSVLLVLALGLSACGGDDDGDPSADPAPATTSASPTPSDSPSTSPSEPASSEPSSAAPSPASPSASISGKPSDMPTIPAEEPPPADAVDLTGEEWPQFVHASQEITCLFNGDGPRASVRCDVLGAKWQAPRPRGCQEAYGDSATLAAKARLTCHGDTIFDPGVTTKVRPGKTVVYDDLWCTVTTDAVRCTSKKTGAGFTVSKGGYSLS